MYPMVGEIDLVILKHIYIFINVLTIHVEIFKELFSINKIDV